MFSTLNSFVEMVTISPFSTPSTSATDFDRYKTLELSFIFLLINGRI